MSASWGSDCPHGHLRASPMLHFGCAKSGRAGARLAKPCPEHRAKFRNHPNGDPAFREGCHQASALKQL